MSIAQYPTPVRLGTFLVILLCLWLPLAIPIYLTVGDRNLVTILTMMLLFAEFLFFLNFWGKNVYGRTRIFSHYGLELSRQNTTELFNGLSVGLCATLMLFGLEGLLGWLVWQKPQISLLQLILEGLISALLIGLAEELVFRGWLLDEFEQNYHPNTALWLSTLIFATLHFLKPLSEIVSNLPSFLGLLVLGIALVWAKRKHQGRLGKSIGLHSGLVWGYYIINVGNLVDYCPQIPQWITGVNNNPIAGVMGLFVLLAIAYFQKPPIKRPQTDKWRRR
ncbi:CPBP family intramembrane glutamic endopeptidase [Merismopedia glauca]|uniref:CPBP family intramembrane metalloprotease n=1 Tax=Merismopedia glauca CCAP 1448/3 TaxID=1296344 RepID=A0A2T1BZW7_9CYAN|nr:type II CAAX endopeptidase family protein [Merismopedia glauca]PSB01467.1 CPBP family intramembrane metalloprotease [Merismopedia glauca CCAP 1448/3]